MEKRTVVMIVVLFVVIVAGMFSFALLKNSELNEDAVIIDQEQSDDTSDQGDVGPYSNITRVDAKHFYIDGVHTLAGEIVMPTPCDLLEANATVAESFPEQITIDFTVVNNSDMCAQVLTPQRFKVSAPASEEATFSARFEGRQIELNLLEAAEGETPDEFELFIKG